MMHSPVQIFLRHFPKVLFLLVLLAVLWKGGKSLETTWLLAGVAGVAVFHQWWSAKSAGFPVKAPRSSVLLLLTGFLVWTILSFVSSSARNYGLDEVLRDAALVLLFLWEIQRAGDQTGIDRFDRKILRLIVIATVIACVVGVAVYLSQPVNRFVGAFFDHRFHTDYWPNAWAEYLLLAWPIMLLSVPAATSDRRRMTLLLLLGFVLGCLALSYSRGALVAFAGQVVIFGIVFWKPLTPSLSPKGRGGNVPAQETTVRDVPSPLRACPELDEGGEGQGEGYKKAIIAVTIIALVAIVTFFGVNALRVQIHPVQSVVEKVTFTADEGGSSISERKQFWNQAVQLSAQKPLFGWGPYSFRFVQPHVQRRILATSDHAHNIFLKLSSERGIPAALLFLTFLGAILWPVLKRFFWRAPKNPEEMFLTVSLLGVLAHNLIDMNLQFVGIALPVWLLLGMLERGNVGLSTHRAISLRMLRSGEVLLASALLVIAILEGRFLVLSSFGRRAEARGDAVRALAWYERSQGEIFSRDMHLSRAYLLLQNNRIESAREALARYRAVNTVDPRPLRLLGDLERSAGNAEAAQAAYTQAMLWNGMNDLTPLRALLELALRMEDTEAARKLREQYDGLLVSYERAIERNTHFIALGPNVEEFLSIMDLFAEFFPKEAPAFQIRGAKVDRTAREERAKVAARSPGYFW